MKTSLLLFLLCFFTLTLSAQKKNDSYRLNIKKASSPIIIDGEINEAAWLEAEVAEDFYMILPMDTSFAQVKTEVRMTYDDDNLYLVATNYEALPGPNVVESLRRDFVFGKNDNFLLFMDPFDDQTNGFSFGANANGAQWDGLMYEGGKVDLSWDNKWTSEVKNYSDKWIFEASIPFKTIRYKKGITEWGINFSRNDIKTTEKSGWAPVPRQFPSASLAYTGVLVWDQPPPRAGANVSIIPYTLGGLTRDFKPNTPTKFHGDVGVDAKVALGSSLNLDLTVNPDFSQVEVDRQVVNLDRFELLFPERRHFFLENADLFANFGYATIRPFFSRRIGLGVPITFGARLSGKINKDWRVGLMNVQTGKVEERLLPAQNFSVLAVQRRVFARSNITAMVINKESLSYKPSLDPSQPSYSQYNRNIGLEYNHASSNNLWTGKALFIKSLSPNSQGDDYVHAANLRYTSRKWNINAQYEFVGEGYNAEVGYVPRRGYLKLIPSASYLFFPTGTKILSHGPTLQTSYYMDEHLKATDNETYFSYGLTLRNLATVSVWAAHDYVKLLLPFDPTNSKGDTLLAGTRHYWNSWGTQFVSKPQNRFTYSFSSRYGGYYAHGTRLNLTGETGYRFQPYISMLVSA
ncbi:MAG TPA: DUF5916 domain-containing protein, partial [Cytophagales bacterium]|nr:DUF5916 domain-containing protein [Cytophagales bacterium]